MSIVRAPGKSKSLRAAPSQAHRLVRQRRTQAPRMASGQRRVKISVTVHPDVLAAVDAEAAAQGTNRSRVIGDVLAGWCAEQRHQALLRQYTMPPTPAQADERAAWDAILDAAATDMLVETDAAGH